MNRRRRPSSPLWRAADEALLWLEGKRLNDESKVVADPNALDLRRLRLDAEACALRYEAGRPVNDGRPTTLGAGTRGTSELTSVEAAAAARIDTLHRGRIHDPVHDHTHRALVAIADAAHELKRAVAAFASIARLTSEAPIDSPACECCTAANLPNPRPWEHYGDLGGKLPTSLHLCAPCRRYGDDHGQLPTPEQVRHHDATGTWRVRVSA